MIVEFNLSEKELREAVAEYVRKRYDAECDPKSAHFPTTAETVRIPAQATAHRFLDRWCRSRSLDLSVRTCEDGRRCLTTRSKIWVFCHA